MVSTEIKYADFHMASHQKQLLKPSSSDSVIYQAACELFEEVWTKEPVRLLGIRTSKLCAEEEPEQLSIFDFVYEKEDEKHKKLNQALDQIRKRYGEGAVMRGTFYEKKPKGDEN